jgi:hypothetical protein
VQNWIFCRQSFDTSKWLIQILNFSFFNFSWWTHMWWQICGHVSHCRSQVQLQHLEQSVRCFLAPVSTFRMSTIILAEDSVRAARWYIDIFIPKITIWVNFGGSLSAKCWFIYNILLPFGKFYGHMVSFVVIWYIFPVLPRKIWQPWTVSTLRPNEVNKRWGVRPINTFRLKNFFSRKTFFLRFWRKKVCRIRY